MEEKERQRKHSLQILSKMKNIDKEYRPRSSSYQSPLRESKRVDYSDSDGEDLKDGSDSDSGEHRRKQFEDFIFHYTKDKTGIDINEQIKENMIGEILNEFSDSPYLLKEEMKDFVGRYQEKQFAAFINAIDSLKEEISDLEYEKKRDKMSFKENLANLERNFEEEKADLKKNHENEIYEWQKKHEHLVEIHEKERIMFNHQVEDKIKNRVEDKVRNRLKDVEKCIIDQVQLQSQIKVLEKEKESLEEKVEEEQKRNEEVVVTLQEVQNAYGDMRDVVLEKYKVQISEMQERVRVAEESNNENTITELRQQVLDARLLLERVRQNHEEEFTKHKLKEQEFKEEKRKYESEINFLKNENSRLTNSILDLKSYADINSKVLEEKSEKIESLQKEATSAEDIINNCKMSIQEKNDEINECKDQITSLNDMVSQVNIEKAHLEKEIEIIHTLRENIKKTNEYVEELKNQLKLKNVKVKYLKKQVKELVLEKQKSESLVAVLPDMQKQIVSLQADKSTLEKSIEEQAIKSIEEKKRIEREKHDEEERKRRIKQEWERRILGIGDCGLLHEGGADLLSVKSEDFSRPESAPLSKLRGGSVRRNTSLNSKKHMGSTLPLYLSHEAKRMHNKQLRMENGRSLKKNNFFNAQSMPVNHLHSLKREDLPRLSHNNSPRVLVLDESTENPDGKGSRLLAIGDRIAVNIFRQCDSHGSSSNEYSGVVKFIGFINGNHTDIYIGIRLDEEVGNTDGYIDGKWYFRCEPNRGKFVRYKDVIKVLQSKAAHVPALQ